MPDGGSTEGDAANGIDNGAVLRMNRDEKAYFFALQRGDTTLASAPEGMMLSHGRVAALNISRDDLVASGWEDGDLSIGFWARRSPEFFSAQAASREALIHQEKDAEIALASMMLGLEPHLPIQRDGPYSARAPNGVAYTAIRSALMTSGVRHAYATSAECIKALKQAVLSYVAKNPGDVLWWRIRPQVSGVIFFGETKPLWSFYFRLAIGSDLVT